MTAASNLAGAAAAINAAWRNGDRVLVNGEVVHTQSRRLRPAMVWTDGHLTVEVRGPVARPAVLTFQPGDQVTVHVSYTGAARSTSAPTSSQPPGP